MVRIRMKRLGRRHRPFYRINAIEKRAPRDGRIIEQLGWYDPLAKDESKQLFLNEDRIKHWLSVGAQPSDTVMDMLAKRGLVDLEKWEAKRKARRERHLTSATSTDAAAAETSDKS